MVAMLPRLPFPWRRRPADPAAPVADGDGVFFVGNSFLGLDDYPLPAWVAALGRAMSPSLRIRVGGDIVFGNRPLGAFLQHRATRRALRSRRYKVWVLQGEEHEPVDDRAGFHRAVRELNAQIVAAGGRTVLFMSWEFVFRPFIEELAASYEEIGHELGVPVIPAGLIYRDCDRTPFPGHRPYWLTASAEHPEGDLHQNEKGTAVNAYATFAMLTGLDPGGRNFRAPGNSNSDQLMRYFSDMAWARVAPRLASRDTRGW
jgi:hypothetical protein